MGQPGSVYGNVQLGEHVGQRTDVIFVPVGHEDGPDPILVLYQVGDVRDREIDTGDLFAQEEDAGVDDDNVVAKLQGHHVLAYLAKPS